MSQINYPFGKTLEFSCTVESGKITSQELVTSGSDVHVSFRLDKEDFLDPNELEDIANQIRRVMCSGLRMCTEQEYDKYIGQAKEYVKNHILLDEEALDASFVHMLAEYMANKHGLTIYSDAATVQESPLDDVGECPEDDDEDPGNCSDWYEDDDHFDDEDDCYDCGEYERDCVCYQYDEEDDEDY